jgi:hypothetical protein
MLESLRFQSIALENNPQFSANSNEELGSSGAPGQSYVTSGPWEAAQATPPLGAWTVAETWKGIYPITSFVLETLGAVRTAALVRVAMDSAGGQNAARIAAALHRLGEDLARSEDNIDELLARFAGGVDHQVLQAAHT